MPSPFYHGNDIGVYLGRQRWGRGYRPKERICARILHFEPGVVHFSFSEHLKLQCLGQKPQEKPSSSCTLYGKAWERGYLHPTISCIGPLMSAYPGVSFTWLMHPGEF